MYDKKSPRMPQDARSRDDRYWDTLSKSMPELNAVFEGFSKDSVPDPLQLLAAISEMVVIYVDHDSNSVVPPTCPEIMSEKKCRFCD